MRKRKKGRKFSRKLKVRKALLKNLQRSFFLHGSLITTEAKTKELQPLIERSIHQAKRGTLADRRRLARKLHSPALKKLFEEIAPQHLERKGGYTRVVKLGRRKSDGAKMAKLELV